MENIIPLAETAGKSPQVYKSVIKEDRLSLYEEAAKRSGYGVNVTAQKGAWVEYPDSKKNNRLVRTQILPGYVEVAVTVPLGQENKDTKLFYDAIKELEQSPK